MTVAIGLLCKDGVLIASDSMASGSGGIASFVTKVKTLERHPVIWTASGSEYVIDEVAIDLANMDAGKGADGALLGIFTDPNVASVRSKIKSTVTGGLKRAYAGGVFQTPVPAGNVSNEFVTDVMVLGYAAGVPWFFEVDRTGQLNSHASRRFAAVGSGGAAASTALALMSHHVGEDLTLDDPKLLAYRTIDTTIRVSNAFVGLPVQIAVCDEGGARVLEQAELDEIGAGVQRWTTLETELLTDLRSGETAALGDIPEFDDATRPSGS